jgi:hypothetical protein
MINDSTRWGGTFRRLCLDVRIETAGKGSGIAPPALDIEAKRGQSCLARRFGCARQCERSESWLCS